MEFPITPLAIRGSNHAWPAERRVPYRTGKIVLVFGERLRFSNYSRGIAKKQLASVLKSLDEIAGKAYNQAEIP